MARAGGRLTGWILDLDLLILIFRQGLYDSGTAEEAAMLFGQNGLRWADILDGNLVGTPDRNVALCPKHPRAQVHVDEGKRTSRACGADGPDLSTSDRLIL